LVESRKRATNVYLLGFQRNSSASKLFIRFYYRNYDEPEYGTLVVTGDGVRETTGYANVWYSDEDVPVFRLEGGKQWYEGEGKASRLCSRWDDASYVFEGGASIPYDEISGIHGVVGADLVLLHFKTEARPSQRVHISGTNYVTLAYPGKGAWIVSSPESPRKPIIKLPKDLEPTTAYACGDKLFLFDTYRPQGGEFVRRCLLYEKSSSGYDLAKQLQIPWMGGVLDYWPETGTALIEALNDRHLFPTYYRFNVQTKRRSLIGFVPADDVLFLKDDVIRTLDGALGKGK
jgi:hypothetical protein